MRRGSTSLRVVTLLDYVVGGGAERAAVEIAMRLGDDVESTVVSSRLDAGARRTARYGPQISELEAAGVAHCEVGRTSTYRLWEWAPLVRQLARERVDVIHGHGAGSNFWTPWLAKLAGIPAVIASDHTPFARVGGYRRWGRQVFVNRHVTSRFADAVVVPSNWLRDALIEHEGVPLAKIEVIPNGAAPVSALGRRRADVRAELGFTDEDQLVVIAAMLRPEKAQDVAIRAVAQMRAEHPRLHLLLAGGGTPAAPDGTRPGLRRVAETEGVDPRVHFLGRRDDVADIVHASDVALLSSTDENLPLAVIEYMQSGTPVVATAVGGVPELIEDGVHGLLVPPRDPDAMAGALRAALHDRDAAHARAEAARRRAAERFDWQVVADRYRALYERVLAAAGRSTP